MALVVAAEVLVLVDLVVGMTDRGVQEQVPFASVSVHDLEVEVDRTADATRITLRRRLPRRRGS